MAKVTFSKKNPIFYNDLKSSVEAYFTNNNIQKTGDWRLYLKAAILIPSAIFIYIFLLESQYPGWLGISLTALLGFIFASIGFNVMHDACHGSYSSKKWVNNVLGLTLNALGGNAFIWKFKHNIVHHTYTNVDGIDDDIAKSPIMRHCNTQKWMPAHRYQHIYVILVYAISSFAWVMMMDFTKYFSQKIFNTPLQKMNRQEHVIFWLSKIMYMVFYIAVPVYFVGWGAWAVGFAAMHVTMGLVLALVFQLAHVVEHTEFEVVGAMDSKQIDNEWAIHQIRTTANFAPKNKVISWFVGGLNYQVEHHLFPRVSHIHYPAISKIVHDTCTRHNLPYHEYSTMTAAVASHFRMMKQLGKKPSQATSQLELAPA
ncbi:MAG TPA: acyl-CoA desaturase [Flavitalea sp.]|nr:acyl-CoA desaturase [Flavitalea sp.]